MNNFSELMSLRFILDLDLELGVKEIQVFGDSVNDINWAKKKQLCHTLQPLIILEEIWRPSTLFSNISFNHIYKEMNLIPYELSKGVLLLDRGKWIIISEKNEAVSEFQHYPFLLDLNV